MSRTAHPLCALALTTLVALMACVAVSQPAAALGLSPNPVVWSYTRQLNPADTIQLSHDLVSVETGLPAGGVVLAGAVGAGDVTLVFQAHVELTGNAQVTTIGIRSTTRTPTAAGWIPGSEPDALSDFEAAALLGYDVGIALAGASFPDGATSDLFFVSYSSLALGDVLRFQPLKNLIFFDVSTPATVVPEPASASLLAMGLAFLARGLASRRA